VRLLDSFIIAIRALSSNKLRSSLTMLGIIIGVAAVITLMSVGRGAEASVTSTFEQVGANVVTVIPRSPEVEGFAALSPVFSTPTLTLDDAEALERIPSVIAITPVNENYIRITYDGEGTTAIVHGVTPEYLDVYKYSLAWGRFITEKDVNARGRVVVLGSEVAKELFGFDDPVGQTVKMKGYRFTIIGVLEAKGGVMMGVSMDNLLVTPVTTFQTRLFPQKTASGEDAVASIAIQLVSDEAIDEATADAESILRKRHRIDEDEKDDFAVVSQEQILGVVSQITGVFTIFLGAIASISLLVASIGIMNIMLVSVTERTREIGIRKAVGAKRRDILLQFLVEASLLSLVGGGIGIAIGWLLSGLISKLNVGGMTIGAVVSPDIVILAISVSVVIGLASGIYPAMRAARLNPIDALHYG